MLLHAKVSFPTWEMKAMLDVVTVLKLCLAVVVVVVVEMIVYLP